MPLSLVVFLVGLCVGSFLNILLHRTHQSTSLIARSRCASCQTKLRILDLIPVVSFLRLKGRCRHCGSPISVQYPVVEFVTGVLFLVFSVRDGGMPPLYLLRDLFFVLTLIIIFVYDLKHYLILDRFTVPAILIAFGVNLWLGSSPFELLLAMAVLVAFFVLQFKSSHGTWVGAGDIRMGALMGAILSWPLCLVALFISYGLGAVMGIALIHSSKASGKTQVPFGTFLSVGTLITMLFGPQILGWYMGLLHL